MIKNNKWRWIICGILLCLNLAFIWGNSLLPGDTSSEISGGLLSWLQSHFPFLKNFTHKEIRKLAHFLEFAAFGLELAWVVRLFDMRGIHLVVYPLFIGLLAACLDETIQLFVSRRGSSVQDVWIDMSGVASSVILLNLGHSIAGRIRKTREEKKK